MTDIRDSTGIVKFDTKSEIIVNVVVEGKRDIVVGNVPYSNHDVFCEAGSDKKFWDTKLGKLLTYPRG